MTVEITAENPRSIRAIELAAGAALVDCQACDCMDARRHPGQACMHVLAVRLHCELVKAQQPKTKTKKPAAATAPAGRPVLTMVRHDDGDFTWERSADVARAARYDAIFGEAAF